MTDSYFYAIIPSILLFISESLPFVPNKYNGITHLIYHILKDLYDDTKKAIPDGSDATTQTDTSTTQINPTKQQIDTSTTNHQVDTSTTKQTQNTFKILKNIKPLSSTTNKKIVQFTSTVDDDFEHINKDSFSHV